MIKLKVADFFCGAGGFSAGFKEAGFDIIFGIDNNKNACETFKYNFSKANVVCEDVMKYNNFPKVDVVIGSPPCKEFSKGNINRNFDDSLIKKMLEIITIINPKYWVLENVEDSYDYIKAPIKKMMCSYDYGGATIRYRVFAGDFPANLIQRKHGKSISDVINIKRAGHQPKFKKSKHRKINPNKPFVTLCSQRIQNEKYLLPNKTALTTSEMAIIQGFPDWFVFPCSLSEMQRQIGNSVCPNVSEAIAIAIKKDFNSW